MSNIAVLENSKYILKNGIHYKIALDINKGMKKFTRSQPTENPIPIFY